MNDFNRDGTQDIVGGMDDDGNSGTIWPILHRSAQSQNHWLAGSLAFDVMPKLLPRTDQRRRRDGGLQPRRLRRLLSAGRPTCPSPAVGSASCVYAGRC
jgi:hypothetical protein